MRLQAYPKVNRELRVHNKLGAKTPVKITVRSANLLSLVQWVGTCEIQFRKIAVGQRRCMFAKKRCSPMWPFKLQVDINKGHSIWRVRLGGRCALNTYLHSKLNLITKQNLLNSFGKTVEALAKNKESSEANTKACFRMKSKRTLEQKFLCQNCTSQHQFLEQHGLNKFFGA